MARLLKLEACLDNLEGAPGVRKRGTAVDELKECMSDPQTLNILDQHSRQPRGQISPTWQDVFRTCHSSLMFVDTEAEEDEKNGVAPTMPKQKSRASALNVLGLVAGKANRDSESPHLQLGSTINICMDMVRRERFYKQHKQYGTMYLNILAKNIIPFRRYWYEMTLVQWKNLADFCMEMYDKISNTEKDKIVEILIVVVKRGSAQTPLALHLKPKLDFFETVFDVEDLDKHMPLQDKLVMLCNTIVTTLALECRLALCKLGEKILRPVLRLRSKSKAELGNQLQTQLYDLLVMLVGLHHPGGVREGESGALAHDWDNWRSLLVELRSLVEGEVRIASEAKVRGHRSKGATPSNLHSSLILLAVEVYRQTMDVGEVGDLKMLAATQAATQAVVTQASTSADTGTNEQSKRRKLHGGLSLLADQLRSAKSAEELMLRLSILDPLLRRYPQVMVLGDYLDLLQTLANILSSCKNIFVMPNLFSTFEALLNAETNATLSKNEKVTANQLWDKIWDMTLRAAGLNQCAAGCHSLLQALLLSARGPAMRHAPLLRLLGSGVAFLSPGSVATLSILAQTRHLPSEQEKLPGLTTAAMLYAHSQEERPASLLDTLLRWLLPPRDLEDEVKLSDELLVPADVLAEALVRLTISSGSTPLLCHSNTVPQNEVLGRIEAVYHEGALQVKRISNSNKQPSISTQTAVKVSPAVFDTLLELLKNEYDYLMDKLANLSKGTKVSERFAIAHLTIHNINVVAHIMSYLIQWNIFSAYELQNYPLQDYLSQLLQKLPSTLTSTLTIPVLGKDKEQLDVLSALNKLYSSRLHASVAQLLRGECSSKVIDILLDISTTTVQPKSNKDDFNAGEITDNLTDSPHSFEVRGRITPYSMFMSEHGLTTLEKKQLAATKVLTSYWFFPGLKRWPSQDAEKLVEFLKMFQGLFFQSKSELLHAVHIISNINSEVDLNPMQIFYVMELLKHMTMRKRSDQKVVLNILSAFQEFLPHLQHKELDDDDSSKKIAITLINGFTKLVNKDTFGAGVRVALIGCLGKCVEVDPEQSWLTWSGAEETTIPVTADILNYLKDPFHEARLAAAKCIQLLFCTPAPSWGLEQTRNWHQFVFEKLCLATIKSFEQVSADCSAEVKEDELSNLTLSALQSYGNVILSNAHWRKKALFSIFQQSKLRKMDLKYVRDILEMIASELNASNIKHFLEASLHFIIRQWLKQEYKLEQFPWSLLNCYSEVDFLKTFKEIIVPILIQQKNIEMLTTICEKMGQSVKEVIEECFASIYTEVLPCMSKSPLLSKHSCDMTNARLLHSKVEEELDEDKVKELLTQQLDIIIVHLFRHLHDPQHWQQSIGSDIDLNFPQPDHPYFELQLVEHTLQYMQSLQPDNPETPLLIFIARDSERSIQVILQKLAVAVHEAPTAEDCLKSFLQYSAFTEILTRHLHQLAPSSFVVRDIVYTCVNLLHNLEASKTVFALAVCVALQDVCMKCIQHCLGDFWEFLPIIINTLVEVTKKFNCEQVSVKAISVLEFIIVENKDRLKKCIKKLDPFPNQPAFQKIQAVYHEIKYGMQDYTLEDEIENFLSASKTGSRVEGLIYLKTQLSMKKPELQRLYDDLNLLRGFSEDCAKSNLHQLVCTLIKLTSDPDEILSIEAAKCLGELGPADLKSLVLQPEQTFEADSAPLALCKRKLELLKDYLIDSDRSVATAAAAALYSLLQTKEGIQALSGIQDEAYLAPFRSKGGKTKIPALEVIAREVKDTLGDNELWCPSGPCSYLEWITKLVCTMLGTISFSPVYLSQLQAVCKAKTEFSAELLPRLVFFILNADNESSSNLISEKLSLYFLRHYDVHDTLQSSLDSNSRAKKNFIQSDKKSVKCMLNVVEFVRIQERHLKRKVGSKPLLELNYLHIARAAQFCSAYFSSLYYAELWGTKHKFSNNAETTFLSIDELCDDSEDGKALHEILLQAYKNIGDPDAVYGCGMSRLLDTQSRIWYFEHCGNWDKVMLMHDICATNSAPSKGMATALHQSGLHHLQKSYIGSEQSDEMKAMQYECCWRLSQWDLPTTLEVNNSQTTASLGSAVAYETHHYAALKALHNHDFIMLKNEVQRARVSVAHSLALASLESSNNVYCDLTKLQALQELEDFSELLIGGADVDASNSLNKWKLQDAIPCSQFEYCEPILSQRACLLTIALEKEERPQSLSKETLAESLLALAEMSREYRRFHVAERSLRRLASLGENIDGLLELRRLVEEARSLWEQGDCVMGRHLLVSVLPKLARSVDSDGRKLNAAALGLYGTWLVETRSENAHTIITKYFYEAIKVLKRVPDNQAQLVQAYRSVARFADVEFQRIDKYMKSPMFESKLQCMQKSEEAAKTLRKQPSQSKDLVRAVNVNEKQSKLDRYEINNITQEREEYLQSAFQFYLLSLQCAAEESSEAESSAIFRVVSLWLENRAQLHQCKQSAAFQAALSQKVPSYKFIPVLPQLVPHLSNGAEAFDKTLKALLERLAKEHPHHTLPNLITLAMLYEDAQFLAKGTKPPQPEARVVAAQALLQKLRQEDSLSQTIQQMETASSALIRLAYLPDDNPAGTVVPIPSRQPILKIKEFDCMHLSTMELPVDKAGNYARFTGIQEYEKSFCLVGGITVPKRITCVGTDGIKRIQLLKGQDDLHQDAVMQQVFTIVNSLLHKNKHTHERKLINRTYKVVPLSQRSGLIEWCENTVPIGHYLVQAHRIYRPEDDSVKISKTKIMNAQRESNEKRLQTYLQVCKRLKPVFHNFFTENFQQPGVWFERRLAYTRSVATTSMIGYILGLGDRHVQNILVDKSTAEVIHIDFGIAFEQGLVLNIPETVPFRLTRDMVDGLGISGVEGVFRRSCEETMTVLREGQETLLTILQVLLYDPLYAWTISPEQNDNNRRGMKGARDAAAPEVEVNKIAERALLRLQQKLMGTEEGTPTSVAGQVNRLIQQAQDPANLSRLFHGWQPYL